MNRIARITLTIALSALGATTAQAQWNPVRFRIRPNRVYTAFGVDPALVTSVGYGRVVPIFGHRFMFAGEVGIGAVPWMLRNPSMAATMDTRDFRARLQAFTSIVHWRSVHLTGSAAFITRGTENVIYDGFNFGADLTGTAGVYRQRWFVAGEFGFDKAIISHITHSEWYRTHIYPDAKDGWYLNAGGTYHYGATAGLALGRVELSGRAGWTRTEDFNALLSPMYATLGVGFGF